MFDQLQNFATALTQVGKSSQSVWNTVGSGIQAVASIMSYSSQKAMGDIDSQIEAEKKRDGKSEESQKKIAKLEAKKRAENLKAQRQAIIANTAVGIMSAISTAGNIYAGLALAAVVAAMGITQLSALDSGSIAQADSSDPTKLELGSRQNSIDVSKSANAGELSYIRGDKGTGSIQDFVPRARGSNMNPNVKYVTGEHGTEVVATSLQGKKVTNTEGLDNSNSNSNSGAPISLTIQAMDSQSIIDRSEDIFNSLEVAAKARGYTLSRLSNI
jgi:hypothetical protein